MVPLRPGMQPNRFSLGMLDVVFTIEQPTYVVDSFRCDGVDYTSRALLQHPLINQAVLVSGDVE